MTVAQRMLEPLQGKTSLRTVFWVYGLAASVVYTLVGLAVPDNSFAAGLYWVVGFGVGIYQLIALWQCAFNGRSRTTGWLVRASVVVSVLLIPVLVYVIVKYPAMLDPLKDASSLGL